MELTNNPNLINLLKVLNDNPEKAKEFYNLNSPKELYDYCISLVPGYEFDEFVEFMKNIAKMSKEKDLDDSDLEKISGGFMDILDGMQVVETFFDSYNSSKEMFDDLFKNPKENKDHT